jgi:hypothetical protein
MKVIYCGNFRPEHSTENHLLTALRTNGHDVRPLQEDDPRTFNSLAWEPEVMRWADMILWTRTGWDWESVYPGGTVKAHADQRRMLRRARDWNIPVVGYHLDIWFAWDHQGVNHVWMPPGVSAPECELGTPRDEFRSKLAFVGSWTGGYHQEHQHRHELVKWLQANFRRDCAFYPQPGAPAVRGAALRDLYASVEVVVGDSCFAGTGLPNYWSDRVPETMGRGGALIHPDVPNLGIHFPHLAMWKAYDWDALGNMIEIGLSWPKERRELAMAGREHVLAHHTYEIRMNQVVDLLQDRGLL